MEPMNKDEDKEMIKKRFTSTRAVLTKMSDMVGKKLNLHKEYPAQNLINWMRDKMEDMDARLDVLTELGSELYALAEDEATRKSIEIHIQTGQDQVEKAQVTMMREITDWEKEHPIDDDAASVHSVHGGAAGGGGGARFRTVTELRPKVIGEDASIREVDFWIQGMKAFLSASNVEATTFDNACQLVYNNMEPNLRSTLMTKLTMLREDENAGPLTTDDVIDMVAEIFNEKCPTLTRRLQLFQHHQANNQRWSSWFSQLKQEAVLANQAEMSASECWVMLLMAGTTDKKLLHELLKIKDPTEAKIIEAVTTYEAATTNQATINTGDTTRQTQGDWQGRGRGDRGFRGGWRGRGDRRGGGRGRGFRDEDRPAMECYRCMKPGHNYYNCKVPARNLKCKDCT